MVEKYQNVIEEISNKFNSVITPLNIITWLENFKPEDWNKALTVLNHFEYFSTNDIIKEFEEGLQEIFSISRVQKIYLTPVGEIPKSGMAMIYYLKKTPSYRKKKVKLLENHYSEMEENSLLVLVDDFSGTGETIISFYKSIKEELHVNQQVIALTVAFLEKAEHTLSKVNIKIVGNKRFKAFSSKGSVFGYEPKMRAIRNFCFKYGEKLYPLEKYNISTKLHPLGFSNSQALIGFEHSIPNNSLPIIWADSYIEENGKHWKPVFPRRGRLLINRAKEFKGNQRYLSSLIYKIDLGDKIFPSKEKYDAKSIQLLSLLYLKSKNRNFTIICHLMGINFKEYEDLIQKGKRKDLLDEEERLTQHARDIMNQLFKKIRFQKRNVFSELKMEEDLLYIPKIFRGNS